MVSQEKTFSLNNAARSQGCHQRSSGIHTREGRFLRGAWDLVWEFSSGRLNFKPKRLYASACSVRSTLARRVRDALGRAARAARGALGISSETSTAPGRDRRTATSIPPADTLRAVANSRNSLSSSILLLTNTGIARGRRAHRRRSALGVFGFTHTPCSVSFTSQLKHLGCQIKS
jgi:hypothetical protein